MWSLLTEYQIIRRRTWQVVWNVEYISAKIAQNIYRIFLLVSRCLSHLVNFPFLLGLAI